MNFLIIGASKGIGLSIAQQLHQTHSLTTVSRNNSQELSNLHTNYYSIDASLNNWDGLQNIPEELHGIVYCPGSINLKPFNRLTTQDFLNDFQQNVLGAVTVIQKVLPNLKKANGASIVLFSTVASKVGMPFHASIASAKSGVEGLAKSLAAELAPNNIRVNAIAPSLTNTPLAQALLNTPEKLEASNKRHPLQRVGTAQEVANLACYLLTENSSWMTGQIIGIDGGMGSLR